MSMNALERACVRARARVCVCVCVYAHACNLKDEGICHVCEFVHVCLCMCVCVYVRAYTFEIELALSSGHISLFCSVHMHECAALMKQN